VEFYYFDGKLNDSILMRVLPVKCNAAALLVVELVITSILSVLQVLNEVHHQFSAGMQVCKLPICSNFCNNLQSAFHESFSFFFGRQLLLFLFVLMVYFNLVLPWL
jgi:hypothetical protein